MKNWARRAERVFHDTDDYQEFVVLLEESTEVCNIRIAAYCLMTNHYHMLVFLIEDKGKRISVIMVEGLTSLQKKILSILRLSEEIYDLSFNHKKKESGLRK